MKKLIPAICMLLVAATLMGTSTYAWFSMNTTVTATGMQVTAKSNATYLLIGNTAECATVKTSLTDTVTAAYTTTGNDSKTCYPVAYCTEAGKLGTNTGLSTEAGKWYTANSSSSNNANDNIKNVKLVNLGDKDYMLTYKVWLTLSSDSENTTKKVKLTYSLSEGNDEAVSAAVVIGSETLFLTKGVNQTTTNTVDLTSTTAVEVTVYIYIDGNTNSVKSDAVISNITGTATLQFDLVD